MYVPIFWNLKTGVCHIKAAISTGGDIKHFFENNYKDADEPLLISTSKVLYEKELGIIDIREQNEEEFYNFKTSTNYNTNTTSTVPDSNFPNQQNTEPSYYVYNKYPTNC